MSDGMIPVFRVPVSAEFVNDQIKALKQAHAELAAKVERLSMKSSNTASLLREHCKWHISLESPAPAPDPVCAPCERCFRPSWVHPDGSCHVYHPQVNQSWYCVPTAEPAPIDPGFRIAIREAVVRWADLGVTSRSVDDITDAVISTMRTYGRDSAR